MKDTRTTWHGCYDDSWRDLIVPEAFCHPAKFAPGLISRIYDHGLCQGWWTASDLIGDPFGGIGCGGVMAAYRGLRWMGAELEAKFVTLGHRCFGLHKHIWRGSGLPIPLLVPGDSRQFAQIVGGCAAVVTSPPYQDSCMGGSGEGPGAAGAPNAGPLSGAASVDGYGTTAGQIGRLPPGNLDGVVTSPPYASGDSAGPESLHCRTDKGAQAMLRDQGWRGGGQTSQGNLANLPAGDLDGVVTSPPYQESLDRGRVTKAERIRYARKHGISNAAHVSPIDVEHARQAHYPKTSGQIGNDTGDTYWQAVAQVYAQCLIALKPGGVMAVVVKDYVKQGKRVPLCDQTSELLLRLGFSPVERIRAMLVKSCRHKGLFGPIVERKERKSFFRRLAERKGSPRIDWEEVLVVRKP